MRTYEELSFESSECPLGCSPDDRTVLKGHDTLHQLEGAFEIVVCSGCGLARTSPRPDPDSIGYYYPADYAPYVTNRRDKYAASGDLSFLAKVKQFLRPFMPGGLTKFLPPNLGRLLEIGCSTGDFLDDAVLLGWSVEGIEFSDQAAAIARSKGHQVWTGQLEAIPLPENKYDAIVGWMVLEHLHEPQKVLTNLFGSLKVGGHLIVSVPNFRSLSRVLFGRYWYCLQLPTHLFHYDAGSLTKLLTRHGFEEVTVDYSYNAKDFLLSCSIYAHEKRFHKLATSIKRLVKKAGWKIHILLPFAYLVGLFGASSRMIVTARKP